MTMDASSGATDIGAANLGASRAGDTSSGQMVRALDWRGAFWVAAGVPPLVLFSIGGIAGTRGSWPFWSGSFR